MDDVSIYTLHGFRSYESVEDGFFGCLYSGQKQLIDGRIVSIVTLLSSSFSVVSILAVLRPEKSPDELAP